MVLSDKDIRARIDRGDLVIEPYVDDHVEPASVDLRLGKSFAQPIGGTGTINTRDEDSTPRMKTFEDEKILTLKPGVPVLATTMETIHLPDDLAASVVGRSSLGRLFVEIHKTAGYCDPGFEGEVTLEMINHNTNPVTLYAGDRVCQILFHELSSPAERPYGHEGSQYQNQRGATPSGLNFEDRGATESFK